MTGSASPRSRTSAPWDLSIPVSSLWPSFIADTPEFDVPAKQATADTAGRADPHALTALSTRLASSRFGTSAPCDLPMPVSSLWPSFIADTPEFDVPAKQAAAADATSRANPHARTQPSPVVSLHGTKERVKARFRLLRRLQDDHDNEGARAANKASVDAAIAFIDSLSHYPPFFATLDDDGSAVIEFEDKATGFFADLTFKENNIVECYRRVAGSPSLSFSGLLTDEALRDGLTTELRIDFC